MYWVNPARPETVRNCLFGALGHTASTTSVLRKPKNLATLILCKVYRQCISLPPRTPRIRGFACGAVA